MNKLQKVPILTSHYQTPLFLKMDSVLYHCVREGSKSFEAVVMPKEMLSIGTHYVP